MERVRVTQSGKTSRYISFCEKFLRERPEGRVEVTAEGRAATKAVIVGEVVKTRLQGILSSASVSESLVNGRMVSSLTLRLYRVQEADSELTPRPKRKYREVNG